MSYKRDRDEESEATDESHLLESIVRNYGRGGPCLVCAGTFTPRRGHGRPYERTGRTPPPCQRATRSGEQGARARSPGGGGGDALGHPGKAGSIDRDGEGLPTGRGMH